MFFLSYGESGPRVVLVQTLLRLKNIDVKINGRWDEANMRAVEKYRKNLGVRPMGPVDAKVFFDLIQNSKLKVIDSIDASAGEARNYSEAAVKAAGISPVINERVPGRGVAASVDKIIARSKDHRIGLLRTHGHGNRGNWISIAIGDPVKAQTEGRQKEYDAMRADWQSYIALPHFKELKPTLARLTPYFAPFGSVELHACRIGKQQELIQKLADTWGVPVVGGLDNQKAAGTFQNQWRELVPNCFALKGQVFTAYPGGVSLASWAAGIEASIPNIAKWISQIQQAIPNVLKRG